MTAPADPQLLLDQAVSRLTGPGGPFEIVEEEVLGTVMPVMKNRGHAIGELISASRTWGDGDYLVTERPSYLVHRARRRRSRARRLLCETSTASARAIVWESSPRTPPNGS